MSDRNLELLLEKLGRSSTPAVKENKAGLTLGSFLGEAMYPSLNDSALVIGSRELWNRLPDDSRVVHAIPGAVIAQAEDTRFSRFVIDSGAFLTGPWLGADTGGNEHLAEEIFEAGRIFRATGREVLWLPFPSPEKISTARLRSTSSVDLGDIPEVDLEEEAPQSVLWEVLIGIVAERKGHAS